MTGPLRRSSIPYNTINVVMVWLASVMKGYICLLWPTFGQALELGGNVKKGEIGELVVCTDSFSRAEINASGHECEHDIPFLQ